VIYANFSKFDSKFYDLLKENLVTSKESFQSLISKFNDSWNQINKADIGPVYNKVNI
jgi:hypothetical protein